MKKIAIAALGAIALVAIICLARAFMLPSAPKRAPAPEIALPTNAREEVAAHLGAAIRFETVSWGDDRPLDAAAFEGFAAFLAETYPAAHAAMTRETVNNYSLLFRWKGARGDLKPIGFIAHIDVVPVEPGTEGRWTHPPFSGVVADGVVWGRGALDDKGPLISLMEAAERLAVTGFAPERDIYFLFGHDEELGGGDGAGKIAETLAARGVHFEYTVDEGSGVIVGVVPGVDNPIALISVAEKGSTTLRLTATSPGGHSSAPEKDTAVSIVSRAVIAVTDHPHPIELDKNTVALLHALASEMSFPQRVALANLWLTGPLVKEMLAKSPAVAASLRTTTAATMVEGGTKVNVLPQQASAVVNYRIHPRDTAEGVKERAAKLINDARITIEPLGGREASPAASTSSKGYAALTQSTRAVFGGVPVAPALMIGGTDSRHYPEIADDNYRYTPFISTPDDLRRFHGTDERVLVDDLARAVAFYEDFLKRIAGPDAH